MTARVPVWDCLVRVLHWALVAAVAAAWLTTLGWMTSWHEPVGYVAVAIVAARFVWGLVGPEHARFARFVRSPRVVRDYLRQVRAATEPRFLGHNPLGGWMVVALLFTLLGVSFTGWLFTTDRFWGYGWLSALHEILAWVLLGLAVLHVAGVVFTGIRHRENLVRAMITGRKDAAEAGRNPER